MDASHPTPRDLPETIPVFPLAGVLLLPRARLPLNVFEPRYCAMVDDALTHPARLIGIIQPRGCAGSALYHVGCAGRIVAFAETAPDRYTVTLEGVSRFAVRDEVATNRPYRRVHADWHPFADDLNPPACSGVDRSKLNALLRAYFTRLEMSCDWSKLDVAAERDLLATLPMICPLKPSEKQALLEAPDCASRTALFMALIEMATARLDEADDGCCH